MELKGLEQLDDLEAEEMEQQRLTTAIELAAILNKNCQTIADVKKMLIRATKILEPRFIGLEISLRALDK